MRINLKMFDEFRVRVSKKYLDFAENHPELKGKTFEKLRLIREHQRKWAEKLYNETRPLPDNKLDYLCFRMFEIFHLEDFQKIPNGFKGFFEGSTSNYDRFIQFEERFKDLSKSINSGGDGRIGIIYREKLERIYMPSLIYRFDKDLPEEVFCIEIGYRKLLPSLFILTYDVYLTDEAIKGLNKISEQSFLSDVRFKNLSPWAMLRTANYSENSNGHVMEKKIQGWFDDLRTGVEKRLNSFFCGYFTERNVVDGPRLPTIMVFALQGLQEPFENWSNKTRAWWKSFGFDFYMDVFKNDEIVVSNLNSAFSPNESSILGYRIIVLWEKFIKTIDVKAYGSEKGAVNADVAYLLDEMLPDLALSEFIRTARQHFENLRMSVYRMTQLRRASYKQQVACFLHENAVRRELMMLERVLMEYEENKSFIHLERGSNLSTLKTTVQLNNVSKEKHLDEVLSRSINFNASRLKSQLTFISNTISEYTASQNTRAIHYFTWVVFWATIISLILNPVIIPYIKIVFSWVCNFFKSLRMV